MPPKYWNIFSKSNFPNLPIFSRWTFISTTTPVLKQSAIKYIVVLLNLNVDYLVLSDSTEIDSLYS